MYTVSALGRVSRVSRAMRRAVKTTHRFSGGEREKCVAIRADVDIKRTSSGKNVAGGLVSLPFNPVE